MVTVVQGKVCAKNHPDRLSRLATIHQRYRRTDGRISYGIGLDLTVGQKPQSNGPLYSNTVIGTLTVDGRAITLGTARTGCGLAQFPPCYTKCNSPPTNGQCINFVLFDVHIFAL